LSLPATGYSVIVRGWVVAGLAAVAMITAVVVDLVPPTEDGYRSTALTSARDARSAVLTAAEIGDAAQHGRVTAFYVDAAIEDARDEVSTAISDLADADVPGPGSQELRDRVLPLLAESSARINDVATAGDDHDALATATNDLRRLADALGGVS
jgi:hypothetical protein